MEQAIHDGVILRDGVILNDGMIYGDMVASVHKNVKTRNEKYHGGDGVVFDVRKEHHAPGK
jgi:hypothetical protein